MSKLLRALALLAVLFATIPSPSPPARAVCLLNCGGGYQAPCWGDGSSGYRVQLFYGIVQGQPDNSATVIPKIIAAANLVDHAYQQDGNEHVNWVCNPSTGKQVVSVVAAPNNDLSTFKSALQSLGANRTDRIYHITTEGSNLSGLGGQADGVGNDDDRPWPNNNNATGPFYAITWNGAQAGNMMHETAHSMGAVQLSAPYSTGAWHVHLYNDTMGYVDGGPYFRNGGKMTTCRKSNYPVTQFTQPTLAQTWDCTGDDYYNPNPAAGSYLSTHWNVYDSVYLHVG